MNADDNFPDSIDRRRRQLLTGIASTVGSLWLNGCGGDGGGDGDGDGTPPFAQPGHRSQLYPTTWPVDMANSNRSGTVIDAGLPAQLDGVELRVESFTLPSFPVFSYTRRSGEVFVVGGQPAILAQYVSAIDGMAAGSATQDPHLTKVNPMSGQTTKLALTRGTGFPYIGGALVHANGYVYVVSQSHLYKIEPETMRIAASVDLPLPADTSALALIYNGLAVSAAGMLITKAFATGPARFVMLDPDTLEVVQNLEHNGASPRLSTAVDAAGREDVYHLDREYTFRLLVTADGFEPDPDWISPYAPYPEDEGNNDEPTSPVVADGRVLYTTNTARSASHPMKIFWQNVEDSYHPDSPPLVGEYMFSDTETPGWNFFHLTVDDTVSGIIVGMDQCNGRIAGYRIDYDALVRLWERELRVSARPAIVADRGHVYCTDYTDGHNHFVVLDLATGTELARAATPATRATIATIIVGPDQDVFFASNEPDQPNGYLHRISVKS
jgi:hypothetical protein